VARLRSVPPGRAGQVWLQHRLSVARRGADLLDQKLRILHGESLRLSLLAERTGADWAAAQREATTWLVRAALLTGERGLRLAALDGDAEVRIGWAHTMGVSYPDSAEVTVPTPSPQVLPGSSAALHAARDAHRRALDAAAQHAVAVAAGRIVAAEVTATRHRLRALTAHWIPRLGAALAETRLSLEEQEHEDAVRRRWAQAEGADRTPATDSEEGP